MSQGIWKSYTTADGLAANFVFTIAEDKLGNMWFGTAYGGLSNLDTNGIFTNYFTTTKAGIYDIEIDFSNNKWFTIVQDRGEHYGTYVVKFDDSTFTYYKPAGESSADVANALGLDSLGQIWCGVWPSGGGYWFDGSNWNYFYCPGCWGVYDGVSEIKTDRLGKLYFTHDNGISTKTNWLFNIRGARDLAFDQQNRLWFTASNWGDKPGLYRYDGTDLVRWTKDDGLLNPYSSVEDIVIDSSNNVWFANPPSGYPLAKYGGVSKFDGSAFTHFKVADGLINPIVEEIYVDSKGDIWFATDSGLSVLHDTTITKINALPEPNIILKSFTLYQNHPNPFNANTCLSYTLNTTGQVELSIYNLLGKEVRKLVHDFKSTGEYSVLWDAKDNQGEEVSSGIYLAKLKFNQSQQLIKLSLIR
jgi:ligand-binding sensor domain-containing protein